MAEKLQFDRQIAVRSAAWYEGVSLDKTTFTLLVVPVPGVDLPQAEAALDAVLQSLMENGIDEAQLERIRMQIRAAQIYARDDVNGLANRYGAALASGLSVQDVQDWPNILQAVTADDVMQAARALFQPQNSVTGYLSAPDTAPAPGDLSRPETPASTETTE